MVDENGALPETIIEAHGDGGGRKRHFDSGESIRLRTSELLDVAGVDLDRLLNEQQNQNGLSETARDNPDEAFPFARLSGVNLIMNFRYFHRSLAPDRYRESTGPKARDVLCVVEISPQYVWSVQGSDVQYQISEIGHPFFINPERERLGATDDPRVESIQVDFQRNGVQLSFQVSGTQFLKLELKQMDLLPRQSWEIQHLSTRECSGSGCCLVECCTTHCDVYRAVCIGSVFGFVC